MRKAALAVSSILLVSATIGPTACGAGAGPSKSEYVKRADAICARSNRETRALARTYLAGKRRPTFAKFSRFVTNAVALTRTTIASLRDLDPPNGDEQKVDAIYDETERATTEVAKAATDRAFAAQLITGKDPYTRANELAREYGLDVCGQGA